MAAVNGWTGQGSYPVGSLNPADKVYLYQALHLGGMGVAVNVLSGSADDVSSAVNAGGYSFDNGDGTITGPDGTTVQASVTPAFKTAVDAEVANQEALAAARHAARQVEVTTPRDPKSLAEKRGFGQHRVKSGV